MSNDYQILHNQVVALHFDVSQGYLTNLDEIEVRLKAMIEDSAGVTFSEAEQLLLV